MFKVPFAWLENIVYICFFKTLSAPGIGVPLID